MSGPVHEVSESHVVRCVVRRSSVAGVTRLTVSAKMDQYVAIMMDLWFLHVLPKIQLQSKKYEIV